MGVNTQAQDLPAPQQAQARSLNQSAPSWMSQYKWDPNWANSQTPQTYSTGTPSSNPMGAVGSITRGATLAKGLAGYMGGSSVTGAAGAADAYNMASGLAAPSIASTNADIAASNQAWLSSLGGDSGTAAADTAATTGAADTAGTAGAADAATTAGGQAGASSGLGAGAGTAAALLPLGLTLWASQKYPATQLGYKYWNGLENNLKGGQGNPQFYGAAMEALNTPQNQVPQAIQQEIWNSGYAPQGKWGMQGPSTAQQQQFVNQTGTQLSGGGRPKGNV